MFLFKELKSNPEPLDTYGTYAVGNKLALCSGLDGVITVWDLETDWWLHGMMNRLLFKESVENK